MHGRTPELAYNFYRPSTMNHEPSSTANDRPPLTATDQVPSIPDPGLRGYLNGFVMGDYLYLVPHFNQNFYGKLTRVDMRDFTWLVELQQVGCGLWVVDCGLWVVGRGLWVVGCGVAVATPHARAHACANQLTTESPNHRTTEPPNHRTHPPAHLTTRPSDLAT